MSKICSVEGCDTPIGRHGAKGFCPKHYTRYRKFGSPSGKAQRYAYSAFCNEHKPTYIIWKGIRGRCYCKSNKSYGRYGERGIKMCDRWYNSPNGFKNFIEDMGDRPSSEHSIERIDVDGDYSPENCKWVTNIVQANNKRNSAKYTYEGETKTITEWGREYGININTIHHRWDRGIRGDKLFYKGDLREMRHKGMV